MRPQVEAFKRAAMAVCGLRKFPFVDFMEEHGLEDILTAADQNNTPAREIVVAVLATCCVHNGKYNHFQVGLLTVMKYLSEQFGSLTEQDVRDLVAILDSGGSVAALTGWMKSRYP